MARKQVAAVEANLVRYLDHFGRVPGGMLHQSDKFHAIEAGPLRRVYAANLSARTHAEIEEALSVFSPSRFPITWMVFPSSEPADLGGLLLERGFAHTLDWTGMHLPLSAAALDFAGLSAFACRRVDRAEALAAWMEIAVAGFRLPAGAAPELLAVFEQLGLARAAPFELYLGQWQGAPAVTGMGYRQHDAVGIYWIATASQARGRGLATALTASLLQEARAAGARLAVLHATPAARSLYERMGFQACCTIGLYTWKPPA